MDIIKDYEIENELKKIENMRIGAMTDPRTPICITLDFSGSMESHKNKIKLILKSMAQQLSVVGKRYFTLIIIGIYNSQSNVWFFGDLKDFDSEEFIDQLPSNCSGTTPLINSFQIADEQLQKVSSACKKSEQLCTIPFFFFITDSLTTENPENYTGILRELSNDVQFNRKIIIQCVTSDNEKGLDFGGYHILLDKNNSEKNIENCMKALRLASSTDVDATNGFFNHISRPPKQNRVAYSDYLSNILSSNMLFYFNNLNEK